MMALCKVGVCYRTWAVSALEVFSDKLLQLGLIFEFQAAHYQRSLPPAEEVPNYRSGGSLEHPSSSGLG